MYSYYVFVVPPNTLGPCHLCLVPMDDVSEREDISRTYVRNIKDPIYDYIEVETFFFQFIDTRQFQRLRNIKQLGTSYFVWPGGSHNRFEHCLGVMHLAKIMVDHLSQQAGLGITLRDRRCVQLAGLLHDLGHGPFSHVFDGQFIPRARPGYDWKHEDASELMFEAMLKENEIEMPQQDIAFVRDLIAGIDRHPENQEKAYLFEIVANKRNGIDVDKFDYIARDTHQIGGNKCSLAAMRLIKSSRVIGDHIAYSNKDITNVFLVFQERWSLHKRVYTHPAAKAIEYMVVDALLAADPIMRISEQVDDPARYVFLTDAILEDIERSTDEALAPARDIVYRLRTRLLYKCVDVLHLHPHEEMQLKDIVTAQAIALEANRVRASSSSTQNLPEVVPVDIIVDWTFVHFGMKDKNPVDLVLFYGKHNPDEAFHARAEEYSRTFPHNFAEVALRVFTRNRSLYGLVQAGFRAVLKKGSLETSGHVVGGNEARTPARTSIPLGEEQIPGGSAGSRLEEKFYDGNPFTLVPPTYASTGSPSMKGKRSLQHLRSTPSSRTSPALSYKDLPTTAHSLLGSAPSVTASKRLHDGEGTHSPQKKTRLD